MGEQTGGHRPGPVYDDAMKVLADDDVVALVALLGVTDVRDRLTIEVTLPAMRTDLLVSTGRGEVPSGVVHVEYVKGRDPSFGGRMVSYWNRIREAHPDETITQYVLLVGDEAAAPDHHVDCELTLRWTVVRVADLDPELLLATPTTAALAALARGGSAERAELFGAALEKIGSVAPRDRGAGLMAAAATLASIVLSSDTIDETLKEATMPVLFRDTPLGRELYDKAVTEGLAEGRAEGQALGRAEGQAQGRAEGQAQGRAEGQAQGRAEGQAQGRAAVLTTLIRQRFGDDPRIEVVVGEMLESSDEDGLTRVMAATCMDDLTT